MEGGGRRYGSFLCLGTPPMPTPASGVGVLAVGLHGRERGAQSPDPCVLHLPSFSFLCLRRSNDRIISGPAYRQASKMRSFSNILTKNLTHDRGEIRRYRIRRMCYTVIMKIYSLQEENEKLKASRGQARSWNRENVFDMERRPAGPQKGWPAASVLQQQRTAAAPPRQSVPPAQRTAQAPSGQRNGQQRQGQSMRALFRIGWLVIILCFFLARFFSSQ